MKINNSSLTKKTVFVYKNIKAANSFRTVPIDQDPATVTVRTVLTSMEIMFQK
ncbi:hypothetical protein ABIB40_003111, partial [Pedobacter sp. UYP30]